MAMTSDIKKAFNANSKKYVAVRVQKPAYIEMLGDETTFWVEITAKKRKQKKR
jgi:hypothetical protein